MKKYHFIITLCISFLLHALLLLFFIQSNLKNFKKGVGDNPKIKISSFQIAPFDAQTKILSSNSQMQKSTLSKKKKQNNTNKQDIQKPQEKKRSLEQNKESWEEKTKKANQDRQENISQDFITQENQNIFNQESARIPIEQTLSYQLADAQTKQDISKFYGAEFGEFGLEEQEYILNNLANIGRITQRYLRYPPNAGMLAQSGGNVVEFYLHPNGDISDLKIIKQSGFILLDRNSIKTIEIAYKDYPHPKTKTLIRFFINYYLR